jgi:hypothetical protein
MKVIDNPSVVWFDIDGTLIKQASQEETDTIEINGLNFKKLEHNIEQLKLHYAQKHFIIVHSAANNGWAETVIKKLGLEQYIDLVLTKARWYVDDEPADYWMLRVNKG